MRYRVLICVWLLTDVCVFLSAFAAAYFLRVGLIFSTDFPFTSYMIVAVSVCPLWLILLLMTRTFALTRSQTSKRNLAYILYAAAVGTALFALSYYFLYGLFFSRKLLIYAGILTALFSWIWHILFGHILRVMLRKDPPAFPTLIVGVTRESEALIKRLNRQQNPLKPVAILDGRGSKETSIDGVPVRGKLNKLEEVLQEGITHLIQCSDLEQSLNLLGVCRQKGITYILLPSVLGIVERDERVESLEGQPVPMVDPTLGFWGWFFQ